MPGTTKQGRITEFLDVPRGRLTVQGTVEAGAVVRSGASLSVQGVISGPLEIEDDAVVTVQGVFSCDEVDNRGTLLLAGVVNGSLPEGALAIDAGTLLNNEHGAVMLEENGHLRHIVARSDEDINLRGHYLVRMPDGTFEALDG